MSLERDPLQWMGAGQSKQLIKTSHNPHDSRPSVNVLWVKSCVFVRNKSIKIFLSSNCYRLKYASSIHNIAHSGGTQSLQRMHWWASDVMLNLSKSVLMKKQTHLQIWWPEDEYIISKLNFYVKHSFKELFAMHDGTMVSRVACIRLIFL